MIRHDGRNQLEELDRIAPIHDCEEEVEGGGYPLGCLLFDWATQPGWQVQCRQAHLYRRYPARAVVLAHPLIKPSRRRTHRTRH